MKPKVHEHPKKTITLVSKKKHLLIILAIAFFGSTLSGCYCARYPHPYHHYYYR